MRICITRTEKGRYSETFIQNQIDSLADYGEIFTVHGGRLPQRRENDELLAPRIVWYLHNISKTVTGKRNNFFGNYGLKRFLKKNQIDITLANYGMAGVHILPVCKDLKIPLAVHFHGFDATQQKILKQYGTAYKKLFNEADGIIAVSAEMKKQLISLGAEEKKISLIPYGIDLTKFHRAVTRTTQPAFLAVGRFIAKKSPMSVIRAFAIVHESAPAATLTMIGQKSDLYEECSSLVRELNLDHAVKFPGIKTPAEVAKYMQNAFAFVQHSVTAANGDMEGTPNTILEAAACSLPIVSTFHAGIKEAVIDKKTGFLVEEHDIDSMAAYMKRLISDPGLAAQMGIEGRKHIEENYDLRKQTRKLFQVLENIITNES